MASGKELFNWLHPYCTTIYASQNGSQNIVTSGSGCFINPESMFSGESRNCFLLTAQHVIDASSNISHIYVMPPHHREWIEVETIYEGINQNVFVEKDIDVAIVKLYDDPALSKLHESFTDKFPCLANRNIEIGEPVCVIGNPGGVDEDSFASGFVRDNNYIPETGNHNCISSDIAMSGGNSGSPLFNNFGRIIGTITHGYSNINDHTWGPNVDTLRLVIPFIMGTDEYKLSTLKGRNPNITLVANPQYPINPINAINFLNGNAMYVSILPSGIEPLPDWTFAFITKYELYGDSAQTQLLEEVETGHIIGGNGFTKALFTPNVDHVVFKGYFANSQNTSEWRWPSISS
jgi:hypothetical protein